MTGKNNNNKILNMGRKYFFYLYAIFFLTLNFAVKDNLQAKFKEEYSSLFKLSLTNGRNREIPEKFFCLYSDAVYAWLELPEKATGKHTLEGYWYKPDGSLYEYTNVPLEFGISGARTAYMWLKINIKSASLFKRTVPEKDEIAGEWKLKVFWDGEKVADSEFTFVYLNQGGGK